MKNNSKDSSNVTNAIMNLVFIWWFAAQFPELVRKLNVFLLGYPKIFIAFCLTKILNINSLESAYRWLDSCLIFGFGGFFSYLIIRHNNPSKITLPTFFTDKKVNEIGSENILEKAKIAFEKAERSLGFRRSLFSFGLIPLREAILQHMLGICIYGTFKASEYSPVTPTVFNYLDIISYKKERKRPDVRYLYSRNFEYVLFSKANRNKPFGRNQKRFPNWRDIGLLLLASNFFWFWFPIALILWPIHAIKRRRRSK
jgi:hypothetical protein